eukprot:jgi/Mesvir1/533/Mv11394-RA.1
MDDHPPSKDGPSSSGAHGDMDEDDDQGMASLQRNLASANSALHGLLRKLGAGFDIPPFPSSNSRLKGILAGLKAEGDEGRQLEALSQLCEMLSIGTEESLATFSVDSFVPVLIGLLNCEYNSDLMLPLLAARALTHLCDVLPSACAAVVHYGAVPVFCARLLTIEYIELAEQSLQALEKISHEHPAACLQAGGLMAVLTYLDFFPTGVQRVAVATAANICRQVPLSAIDQVVTVIPMLTNLMQYPDTKVVEQACVCVERLVDAFASSPHQLDLIATEELIAQVLRLIAVAPPGGAGGADAVPPVTLSPPIYTGLIRLLVSASAASPNVAKCLLQMGISSVLRNILASAGMLATTMMSPATLTRSTDQLYEIVSLIHELLPPMPAEPSSMLSPTGVGGAGASASGGGLGAPVPRTSSRLRNTSGGSRREGAPGSASKAAAGSSGAGASSAAGEEEGVEGDAGVLSAREKALREHPELLVHFGKDLLPVLVQVYGASVNPPVRKRCLSSLNKLLYFSTSDMLQPLKDTTIASFLAGLLSSKDTSTLSYGLSMAELLMSKLPAVFSKAFVKEGLLHAIDKLIEGRQVGGATSAGAKGPGAVAASIAPRDTDTPPLRPRRSAGRRVSPPSEAADASGSSEMMDAAARASAAVDALVGALPPSMLASGMQAALSPVTPRTPQARDNVVERAAAFKATYFGEGASGAGTGDSSTTEGMRELGELCRQLLAADTKGEHEPADKRRVLSSVLRLLCSGGGMSTFEFLGSGAIAALLTYLTGKKGDEDSKGGAGASSDREALDKADLLRLRQFVDVALVEGAVPGVGGTDAQGAVPKVALQVRLGGSVWSLLTTIIILPCMRGKWGLQLFRPLVPWCVQVKGTSLLARVATCALPHGRRGHIAWTACKQELKYVKTGGPVCQHRKRGLFALLLPCLEPAWLNTPLSTHAFASLVAPCASFPYAPPPPQVLVSKLQDALSSVENFPVLISQLPSGGSLLGRSGSGSSGRMRGGGSSSGLGGGAGGLASGGTGSGSSGSLLSSLSALMQPFKLRLVRDPSETRLRDYSTYVVLIEPLATVAAVEDFLLPRVRRPETATGAGGSSGAAPSATAAALTSAGAPPSSRFMPTSRSVGAGSMRLDPADLLGGADDDDDDDDDGALAGSAGLAAAFAASLSRSRSAATRAAGSVGTSNGTGAAGTSGASPSGDGVGAAAAATPAGDKGVSQGASATRPKTRGTARAAATPGGASKAAGEGSQAATGASSARGRKGKEAADAGAGAGTSSAVPVAPAGGRVTRSQQRAKQQKQQEVAPTTTAAAATPAETAEDSLAPHESLMDEPLGLHIDDGALRSDEEDDDGGMSMEDEEDFLDEEDMDEDEGDLFEEPVRCGGDRVHELQLGGGEEGAAAPSEGGGKEGARGGKGAATGAAGASASPSAGAAPAGGAAGSSKPSEAAGRDSDNTARPATNGADQGAGVSGAPAATPSNPWDGRRHHHHGHGHHHGLSSSAGGDGVSVGSSTAPQLELRFEGRLLSPSMTIFQAIQRPVVSGDEGAEGEPRSMSLWDTVFTIHYSRAKAPEEAAAAGMGVGTDASAQGEVGKSSATTRDAGKGKAPASTLASAAEGKAEPGAVGACEGSQGAAAGATPAAAGESWGADARSNRWAPLHEYLSSRRLPCNMDKTGPAYDILVLLRLLEHINRMGPRLRAATAALAPQASPPAPLSVVPQPEFLSPKLTPKLVRQLQDALVLCSGGLPAWCTALTSACPFLFPLDARRQYFFLTTFGLSRALQRLQQQNAEQATTAADRELRVGRLQRQKVRVSRSRVLESAIKVMELYSSHKAVLEVEYFGEVGTGLGPTLEFYTLLSHELQRANLGIWRSTATTSAAAAAGDGAEASRNGSDAAGAAEGDARAGAHPSQAPGICAVDRLQPSVTSAAGDIVPREDDGYVERSTGTGTGGSTDKSKADAPKTPPLEYVVAVYGLFPKPIPPVSAENAAERKGSGGAAPGGKHSPVELFRLLGRVVAKALQDGRLLDIPLSRAFYKLMLGEELDLFDIRGFDPSLGANLEEMEALVDARRQKADEARATGTPPPTEPLLLRGCPIEDLCLDFTLPGYPEYELKPGGRDITVTSATLEEYVSLVVDATLRSGIRAQMDAFASGFNQVFPLTSLRTFYADELELLLCGTRELWTAESLAENIKFDHGYTAASPPIRQLLEVLCELTPEEQRCFLRFVTGAPRLPPGGLAALNPRLTIVRKQPTGMAAGGSGSSAAFGSSPPVHSASAQGTPLADRDLPSVMTCANYLKLPPYSSKETMKQQLLIAIREGQGSFDLS